MSRFRNLLSVAAAAAVAGVAPGSATAATLKTLYSFCSQPRCVDGKRPAAGVIMDSAGNLYGTTVSGGAGTGIVFRLAPDGGLTVLHAFASQASADGAAPDAPLIMAPDGTLFGAARHGGDTPFLVGAGAIFELSPKSRAEEILYDFCSDPHCADGSSPNGILFGNGGDLYGVTSTAESDLTGGVLFRLSSTGPAASARFGPVYAFPYPLSPSTALVAGAGGTLYGAVSNAKPSTRTLGMVFALYPSARSPTVLYRFCSRPRCADGFHPTDLLATPSETLYGTTAAGGDGPYGQGGTLFSLTPNATNSRWKFRLLYSFCQKKNCADGASPLDLVIDAAGNLYGTAGAGREAGGLVFRFSATGSYQVLYRFCSESNCADGSAPHGPLIMDRSGHLYGTTGGGGANNDGTIFELTP
jgi:uncharacterized repeat protein (TIGR03803 family)